MISACFKIKKKVVALTVKQKSPLLLKREGNTRVKKGEITFEKTNGLEAGLEVLFKTIGLWNET